MFIKLLIISILFLGIAFSGLAIRILLKSGGRFPETHIGKNKEMRKLGISCAQKTDIGCRAVDPQRCVDCKGV
jgi:hypothetical protein